jgi:hypothetical protein
MALDEAIGVGGLATGRAFSQMADDGGVSSDARQGEIDEPELKLVAPHVAVSTGGAVSTDGGAARLAKSGSIEICRRSKARTRSLRSSDPETSRELAASGIDRRATRVSSTAAHSWRGNAETTVRKKAVRAEGDSRRRETGIAGGLEVSALAGRPAAIRKIQTGNGTVGS